MSLVRALRIRPFALLWSGQIVSHFGDAIHAIAMAWLVLELTGSAAAMGVVLAANIVAFLAFSLVGGVVVDRVPRLQVMIASDLARGAVVTTIALLIAAGRLEFWHLIVLSAAFGVVDAFFHPAYTAVIPDLAGIDDRASANSLTHLSRRIARLVGPAVGATLVATGGTAAAFAIDALTFALSAILVFVAARSAPASFGVRVGAGIPATVDDEAVAVLERPTGFGAAAGLAHSPGRWRAIAELREGLGAVTSEPRLWIAIVLAGVTGITLAGPLSAGLPLLVSEHLGGDVGTLGLIQSMLALGAIGAAVVLGSLTRLRRRGPLLYASWIVLALGAAVAGMPVGVAGVAVAALFMGVGGAVVSLTWASTIQELVPSERLGRVSSIDAIGSTALEPIGFIAAGAAADEFGPAVVFVWGGLASAGVLSLALLHPAVRRFD